MCSYLEEGVGWEINQTGNTLPFMRDYKSVLVKVGFSVSCNQRHPKTFQKTLYKAEV